MIVSSSLKLGVYKLRGWTEVADLDGFNFQSVVNLESIEHVIEFMTPDCSEEILFRIEVEKLGREERISRTEMASR